MISKKFYSFGAAVALAICLAGSASAVDWHWTGNGNDGVWANAANWDQGTVPPSTAGDIYVDPVTYAGAVIISASDVVQNTGTLQGPEWGQTLNISGTVNAGYALSTIGDPLYAGSTLNLYGTGSVTAGDSFFIGEPWWFQAGMGHTTVNLYDNSLVTAPYVIMSGHLNIFGGTVTATSGFLTGTATTGAWGSTSTTDALRMIDIAGGKLVVVGDATSQMNDLISRGVLEGNGIVGNVNIDTTSMPGWTVVTVPEPSSVLLLGLGGLALFMRRRSD
jgi:PEP-CTERM motif